VVRVNMWWGKKNMTTYLWSVVYGSNIEQDLSAIYMADVSDDDYVARSYTSVHID
jgi:hypothetical protein